HRRLTRRADAGRRRPGGGPGRPPGDPGRRPGAAVADRVQAAAPLGRERRPGAAQGRHPPGRVALRLRRRLQHRRHLHQLPAPQARHRRAETHPHRPRRRLRAAQAQAVIRRLSLRARLLAITLALLVTGLTVVSAVVVRQLETELTARLDAQLTQMATALGAMPPTLVDLLRQRAARNPAPAPPAELDLIQELRLAFLAADGTVAGTVGTPPPAGTPRLPRLAPAAVEARGGTAVLAADGTVAGTVETPPSAATPRLPRLDTAAVEARAGRPFTVPGDGEEQWRAVAVPSRAAGSGHASVVAAVSLGAMNSTVQRV